MNLSAVNVSDCTNASVSVASVKKRSGTGTTSGGGESGVKSTGTAPARLPLISVAKIFTLPLNVSCELVTVHWRSPTGTSSSNGVDVVELIENCIATMLPPPVVGNDTLPS